MTDTCADCGYCQQISPDEGKCFGSPPDYIDQAARNTKPILKMWERKRVNLDDRSCSIATQSETQPSDDDVIDIL